MARTTTVIAAGAAIFTLIAWPAPAEIPCDCDSGCAERADPSAGFSFDDEEHRLWYQVRFWTGACHGDLFWCFSGSSWYDVMGEVLSQAPAGSDAGLCPRLFELGRAIGHEWARDNDIRLIHTDDLDAWRSILLDAEDPEGAVGEVEKLTASRLQ